MTNESLERALGRIEQKVDNVNDDIKTIQKDIIHIKKNDKEKLERIAKTEMKLAMLDKWREGHIQANQKTNKDLVALGKEIIKTDDKIDKNQQSHQNWIIGLLIMILATLIALSIDIFMRFS